MLIDITDQLDIAARNETLEKLEILEKFEKLKAKGLLEDASDLLESSCNTPHIFHGHYKKLFTLWRKLNKDDLANQKPDRVVIRVLKAIKLNDEMLTEMSRYWSEIHKKKMTKSYFAKSYNHLKISDGNALKKAAELLHDKTSIKIADKLIRSFGNENTENQS